MPDLVIADIRLPSISGITLVDILKSSRVTRAIPILAFSSDERVRDEAMAVGCADFLLKPVAYPDLTQAVERAIRRPT